MENSILESVGFAAWVWYLRLFLWLAVVNCNFRGHFQKSDYEAIFVVCDGGGQNGSK